MRDTRLDTLFMLAAAQTRDKADVTPEQMLGLAANLRQIADYILIDSPAGIEHGFQNAVMIAGSHVDCDDAGRQRPARCRKVIYLLERDYKACPGLILNRYNSQLSRSGEMRSIDDVMDILAIDLIGVVPEDSMIVLTTDRGTPAVYDKRAMAAPGVPEHCPAHHGNNVPLMDFRPPTWRTRPPGSLAVETSRVAQSPRHRRHAGLSDFGLQYLCHKFVGAILTGRC
ncbi:MAG: hypothetical protein R2854_01895 [Caldilineaceae bacterium]